MKLEEERHKREIELQMKESQLENERRTQDREHEFRMFKLLIEAKPSTSGSIQGMPLNMARSSSPLMSSSFPHMPWEQGIAYQSTSSISSLQSEDEVTYTSL